MSRELLSDQHPSTIDTAIQVAKRLIGSKLFVEAYNLVEHFLTKVGVQGPARDTLKHLEGQLLSRTIRRGFRQGRKSGKRKTKKKRR